MQRERNMENLDKIFIDHQQLLHQIKRKDLPLFENRFTEYMNTVDNLKVCNFEKDSDRWSDFMEKNKKYINRKIHIKSKFINPDHNKSIIEHFKYRCYFLFKILDHIWKGEKVVMEDLKKIQRIQILYIFQMVKKKFDYYIDMSSLKILQNDLNNLKITKLKKRKEEILKFILKRFFNHLFKTNDFLLSTEKNIFILHQKFLKDQIDLEYVKYFFTEEKYNKSPTLKIYNDNILTFLITNKELKDLIYFFIDNILIREYKKEVTLKMFSAFRSIRNYLGKKKFVNVLKKSLLLIEQGKFKLPWTVKEIELSINYFKDTVKKSLLIKN